MNQMICKQTIQYMKQIERIVSYDCSDNSALHYRHLINQRLAGYQRHRQQNNSQSNSQLSLISEHRCCVKCLSKLKKWRIKPKSKVRSKTNQLVAVCTVCQHINRFDGIHRQSKDNISIIKTPTVKSRYESKSSLKTPKTPNKTSTPMSDSMTARSAKQKQYLQKLLSNNKMRKVDQKTGLFDFLQNCT